MVLEESSKIDSLPGMEEVGKWVYDPALYCVARFLYRPLNDLWFPHLEVTSSYGTRQAVLIFGQMSYKLSEERFCAHCFSMLEQESYYPYCAACVQELELFFLRCYQEGIGLGEGDCDYEAPRCGSKFCGKYCKSGFTVYIAVGGKGCFKVGVTKKVNVFYKLLEEGVFGGLNVRLTEDSLGDALELKAFLKKELGAKDYLTMDEKLQIGRSEVDWEGLKDQMEWVTDQLRRERDLVVEAPWDLRSHSFKVPDIEFIRRTPLELQGELIGFWGRIGFFQDATHRFAFDLKSLVGRILENVVG